MQLNKFSIFANFWNLKIKFCGFEQSLSAACLTTLTQKEPKTGLNMKTLIAFGFKMHFSDLNTNRQLIVHIFVYHTSPVCSDFVKHVTFTIRSKGPMQMYLTSLSLKKSTYTLFQLLRLVGWLCSCFLLCLVLPSSVQITQDALEKERV